MEKDKRTKKLRKINLLLAEDNEDEIILLTEALKSSLTINDLIVVRDGEAAIEYLMDSSNRTDLKWPDILLLDLNMPKKNGLEVLHLIKSTPGLKQLPVIIFTTSKSESDISESYENFASCYITKPMSYDGLKNVVKQIEDFWMSLVELPKSN